MLHTKVIMSYSHIFELVPNWAKDSSATAVNAFDSLTLCIFGLFIKFGKADAVYVVQVANFVECSAVVLFLVFIPESPRWLLQSH